MNPNNQAPPVFYTLQEFKAKHCKRQTHIPYRNANEGLALSKRCEELKIPVKKVFLKPVTEKERSPLTGTLHDLGSMNTYPENLA